MSISTVPAVLSALVAALRTALPGVDVVDGQPAVDPGDDCLILGFTGTPGDAAVEDNRTREEIGTDRDRERYTITCLASAWRGDDHLPEVVRARAFELVDELAGVVAADQSLGGACMRARVSSTALAQSQTSRGPVAVVRFEISVDAFTGRAA